MGNRDMLFKTRPAGLGERRGSQLHSSIGALAMLCVPSSLFAASSVTLVWDPSTSTNIAGYRIYYGPASRTYTNTLAVGNVTNATISNLITGATYYFAATAYDTANLESDFSNEVGYTNVVLAPPTIVLTSPANNATFTAPATISLAASVTRQRPRHHQGPVLQRRHLAGRGHQCALRLHLEQRRRRHLQPDGAPGL